MTYSELLQLAKGWGNFVSDRINIWRLLIKGLGESGKRYQRLCIEFLGVWIAFATFVWYNSIKMNDTFGRSMGKWEDS